MLRLRNDPHWRGSAFEAADILWDGNDGLQMVSLFETKPASAIDARRVSESVLEKVEASGPHVYIFIRSTSMIALKPGPVLTGY